MSFSVLFVHQLPLGITFPSALVTPLMTCPSLGRSCPEFAVGSYKSWLNIGFQGIPAVNSLEALLVVLQASEMPAPKVLLLCYPGIFLFRGMLLFAALACFVLCVWHMSGSRDLLVRVDAPFPTWVPGIELGSVGFASRCHYPPSHLAAPIGISENI